jgi:hypothetical protein
MLFFHMINKSFWNEQRKFHRSFITRVTPLVDQGLLTPPFITRVTPLVDQGLLTLPFITRVTPLVDQGLLTPPFITRVTPLVHQGLLTPPGFDGVRVARCLVFCVVFCGSLLSFCPFSFGRCAVCPSTIYGF